MNEKEVIQLLEHMGRCYRSARVPMRKEFDVQLRARLEREMLSYQKNRTVVMQSEALWTFSSFARLFQIQALRPVLITLVVAVVGAGTLFSVAEASLPGDSLYTIKLVRERAQIRLKRDGLDRTEFAVGLAKKRANEVRAVVESNETKELKNERLKVAVAGLHSSVGEATDALTKTGEKKNLAAMFERETADVAGVLQNASDTAHASNGDVAATVAEALAYVTETKEAVRIAAHPPTDLATSLIASSGSNPAEAVIEQIQATPRSFQQPVVLVAPQSVFALPLGISVNSPSNLPLATSIYGELPFAQSIQSNPGF